MIHVSSSRFKYFITSDDFEEESLLQRLELHPFFNLFSVNGRVLSSPSFPSSSSFHRYDVDVRLVPASLAHTSYKFVLLKCFHSSAVYRVTEIPLSFLNVDTTPGVDFVVDYSGIVITGEGIVLSILNRIIISGGILSVRVE